MVADIRFSSIDLTRLTAAVDTCVRPYDFPTIEEWRACLLDKVMELLDAPLGRCDLAGIGLKEDRISKGYDGVFENYVSHFMHLDPSYDLMQRVKMTTYTRRHRHRIAGEVWTARYRRSVVFQEFYLPNQLLDGAGIWLREGGMVAHVHAETRGEGSDLFDERGRRLLQLLEPAFRAAALAIQDGSHFALQAHALLDGTSQPLALLDRNARWVHRTPALQEVLRTLPSEAAAGLLELVQGLALRLIQPAVTTRPSVTLDSPVVIAHGFRVSGVLLGPDGPFARPYALIRLEPLDSSAPGAAGRARRAGLTGRETEVAMLLARGLSDKAIAVRLQISWATARRHTENILRKLKIGSRGAVAHALGGLPADLD